jgi:hypothetical protein
VHKHALAPKLALNVVPKPGWVIDQVCGSVEPALVSRGMREQPVVHIPEPALGAGRVDSERRAQGERARIRNWHVERRLTDRPRCAQICQGAGERAPSGAR